MSLPAALEPDNLPSPQSQEELFIHNLFIEPSVTQAALKAGYSEYSAKSHIYAKLRNPKFQEKIREYARTHELIESVPTILRLENNALKWLADKPQELPKYAAILKQKKQIAGLLQQDSQPAQAMISIGQVANLMLNMSQVDSNSNAVNADIVQGSSITVDSD
jgi:phage terminase small subunit